MRLAIDTNVLAYAEDVNNDLRGGQASALLARRLDDAILIPAQVFAELFWVLMRKSAMSAQVAQEHVERWISLYPTIDTTAEVLVAAMELVAAHRIGFWDAIVMASAASAGCELLLSEDFQHGFKWRGVTVQNPFREPAA